MASPTQEANQIAADKTSADEALKAADAQELHALFLRSEERRLKLVAVLNALVGHYAGERDAPRFHPSTDAVAAMEKVALAAINLAQLMLVANRRSDEADETRAE
jgi:hypothetical protein